MKTIVLASIFSIFTTSAMALSPELKICQGLDELTIRNVKELRRGEISQAVANENIELFKKFECAAVLDEHQVELDHLRQRCEDIENEIEELGHKAARAIMDGEFSKADSFSDKRLELAQLSASLKCH